MLTAAREAGASDLFVMLAAVDPAAVEVSKNFVARRLARACDETDRAEWPDAIKRMADRSGDYMAAVWDGDLAEALYRADGTNSRVLFRLFDRDVLLSALAEDRGSIESAERWFDQRHERYGWPST